jgi:hypothetical protein
VGWAKRVRGRETHGIDGVHAARHEAVVSDLVLTQLLIPALHCIALHCIGFRPLLKALRCPTANARTSAVCMCACARARTLADNRARQMRGLRIRADGRGGAHFWLRAETTAWSGVSFCTHVPGIWRRNTCHTPSQAKPSQTNRIGDPRAAGSCRALFFLARRQHGMAWHGMAWHGTARHGTA